MHFISKITAILTLGALCGSAALAQDVTITVNGRPASLDPAPIERAGRVFVPLRGVFERLGAGVVYENGLINAQGGGRSVSLRIGSNQAEVNGQPQVLDVAPFIIGASTYVPLRFVAQALGAGVNWDNDNRIVAISTGAAPAAPPPNQAVAPHPPQRSPISLALARPENSSLVPSARPTIAARFQNGTAEPASVRVRLDGNDITNDTIRSPEGVSFTPASNLSAQRHIVRITGRDGDGRPFDVGWSFTSGTNQTQNYISLATPPNDRPEAASFMVTGKTVPNATVEIEAGASTAVGGIVAFGGDHERIQFTADGNGNFSRRVNLNAGSRQMVTLVVTSTAPQTNTSVKATRRFPIG